VLEAIVHFIVAEDVHQPHPQHPEHTAPEAAVFRYWRHHTGVAGPQRLQMKGPWPTKVLPSPVAIARVDHSRWIADCPFEGCHGAEYVSKTDRRFFCIACSNGGTGQWIRVQLPDEVELAAIEATLGRRPSGAPGTPQCTRHWDPRAGETVADLEAENQLAGV
jgi:hypothetical protein